MNRSEDGHINIIGVLEKEGYIHQNTNQLYIVNYCHPNCKPLQNIMRLPEKQAFEKAGELARKNPETNTLVLHMVTAVQ